MTTAQFLAQIETISIDDILSEHFTSGERIEKKSLSKRDLTLLSNKIAHFKDYPVDSTIKCIYTFPFGNQTLQLRLLEKREYFDTKLGL